MQKITCFELKLLGLFVLVGTLSACGGSPEESDNLEFIIQGPVVTTTTSPDPTPPDPTPPAVSTPATWASGYVTSFNQSAVSATRSLAKFRAHLIDGLNALSVIKAEYALSTGLTGQGQRIAIIDDGVRTSHDVFANKDIIAHPNSEQYVDSEHGTAVASIAAGNGPGMMGVAPGADLYTATRSYSSYLDWDAEAEYVLGARDAGAIVLNNSWGLSDRYSLSAFRQAMTHPFVTPYVNALRTFAQDGVIVFALANDPTVENAYGVASLPELYTDLETSWITVIDVDPTYQGDRVISVKRHSAPCQETAAYCIAGRGLLTYADGLDDAEYSFGAGTSFVAPQVSGAIALLAEAFPNLTPQQLRARLLMTADNSFFESTGKVTFAPGYEHGYSYEYGHGIMDLRAALLPIGSVTLPLSRTDTQLDLTRGQVALVTSPVVGQALAQNLSHLDVMARDDLYGTFRIGADSLVAARPLSVDPAERIKGLIATGPATAPNLLDTQGDTFAAIGFAQTSLPIDGGTLRLLENGSDSFGLGVTQSYETDLGTVRWGMTSLRENGSVLGMTTGISGDRLSATTVGLELGYGFDWGTGGRVSIDAHLGQTRGASGGVMAQFDNLRYDAIGVTVAQRLGKNRQISLTLARPLAVSDGTLQITLPSYSRAAVLSNTPDFSTHRVSLVPQDRQIDAELRYHQDLGQNAQIALGIKHSENYEHVAQSTETAVTLGFDYQF